MIGAVPHRSPSVRELIDTFPDRHPFPVKCVLYLAYLVCPEIPWSAIHKLLENMGYVEITVEQDIGGGEVIASTWASPDEV